jgi:Na+/H+-dicarboxylate symporter
MDDRIKECMVVTLIGLLAGILSSWNRNICWLPGKPTSTIFVYLLIPLIFCIIYIRKANVRDSSDYPILRWAAIYWFIITLLSALIQGFFQALRAVP